MRVWTRGAEHVALTARGIFIFRPGEPPRCFEAARAARDHGSGDVLAVAPSGGFAWVDRLARVSLEDGTVERPARAVLVDDVVALDEARVAAVLGGTTRKAPPALAIGDPRAAGWEMRIELRAEAARRVEAFSSVLWAEGVSPPWYRTTAFGPGTVDGARLTRVAASEHGLAIAGARSGLVGVLRPGADKLSCVLRVPSQEEARLDAIATAEGVLVTLVIKGDNAAVAHFDDAGRCFGVTEVLHGSIGAVVAGDRVLVHDDRTSSGDVRVFRLPGLEEVQEDDPYSIGAVPVDAHASRDGRTVVFGAGGEVVVLEVSPGGLHEIERCSGGVAVREKAVVARLEEPARAAHRFKPSEGPPALGFPTSKEFPAPWSGQVGSPLTIVMSVRSTGGAGSGVRVDLSGPAITEEIVVPEQVAIGAHAAPFAADAKGGGSSAVVPGAPIPRGLVYPLDPKPNNPEVSAVGAGLLAATHVEVRLTLRAARAGSALLSVAIRPSAGASAPMKWTRPVHVEP